MQSSYLYQLNLMMMHLIVIATLFLTAFSLETFVIRENVKVVFEDDVAPRIFGGYETSYEDYFANFRYMGEIYAVGNRACMGALIAPKLFLTLAYCVTSKETRPDGKPKPVSSLEIVFHRTKGETEIYDEIRVVNMNESNIILHPLYNHVYPQAGNDIAIIVLPSPINNITPMTLVKDGETIYPSECYASGWDITNSNNGQTKILQNIRLPLTCLPIEIQNCKRFWRAKSDPFKMNRNHICAGYYGGPDDDYIGLCNGERGTIVACRTVEDNRVGVGIMVQGSDCINNLGENKGPSVFEKLVDFRNDFIDPIVQKFERSAHL